MKSNNYNDKNAIPNEVTILAMMEAEKIAKDSSIKGYRNVDELFEKLEFNDDNNDVEAILNVSKK